LASTSNYPYVRDAGDTGSVSIGDNTNVQDGTTISSSSSSIGGGDQVHHTIIGSNVTIGHQASIHGCTIEDEALIGMGAILLEGSRVEKGAMVAAGAVVQPGTIVPAGEIWGGRPAKHLRALKPEEKTFLSESAEHYVNVSAEHIKVTKESLLDIAKAKGLLASK
jgi:carbonic anhydrase/acetyltransferase-like protein (isoleucine patch superfamily)